MRRMLIPILIICLCTGCASMVRPAQTGSGSTAPGQVMTGDVSGNAISGAAAVESSLSDNALSGTAAADDSPSGSAAASSSADSGKSSDDRKPSSEKGGSGPETLNAASLKSWAKGSWQSGTGITLIIDENSATIRGFQNYDDITFAGELSADEKAQSCRFIGSAAEVAGIPGSFADADITLKWSGDTETDGTAIVTGGIRSRFINYQVDPETVTFHAVKQKTNQ